MLGIVHMEEMDPVEVQCPQAFLEGSAGLSGVKSIGLRVAIELGRDDEAFRKAATLADDIADPLLAPSESVDARRVEEVGRSLEDRLHRPAGAVRVDTVAIGVGHVRQ
jgi:hypothetical protein